MKVTEEETAAFLENSDVEDDSKHEQLIENVISLTKPPRIKKPSRTEPTVRVSEYDLVRSITGTKGAVHIHDLANVLKHTSTHVKLGKKIKDVEKKAKTLPKPLEKPQADRLRRAVGYEKAKKGLDKWEAVITANRASLNLTFPLKTDVNFDEKDKPTHEFRVKSELQKKLEEVDKKYEVHVIEPEEEKKPLMTLEEIMERRQEAAKMRAHLSYKEAKARRQNKIKSKKYHRVQRREKMKQQVKEFELLQKTDPEAALKKLGEIEKARAEERFSLRHKSTGQWARNKQIRAKYDKESRQVLAQQLAISKDLTQKLQVNNADDSESESEEEITNIVRHSNPNNPWVGAIKTDEEIDTFIKSYRKYWDEKNNQEEEQGAVIENEVTENLSEENHDKHPKFAAEEGKEVTSEKKIKKSPALCKTRRKAESALRDGVAENLSGEEDGKDSKIATEEKTEVISEKKLKKTQKSPALSKSRKKAEGALENEDKEDNKHTKFGAEEEIEVTPEKKIEKTEKSPVLIKTKRKAESAPETKTKKKLKKGNSQWKVTGLGEETALENVFDDLKEKIENTVQKKAKAVLKGVASGNKKANRGKSKKTEAKRIDLTIAKPVTRPVIDEELLEKPDSETEDDAGEKNKELEVLQSILNATSEPQQKQRNVAQNDINPNRVVGAKPVILKTQLPELLTLEENGSDDENDNTEGIAEAFEDEDVVQEFNREKAEVIKKSKPENIDLTLPGWGTWGGKDVKVSKKKRKKFIIKFPKKAVRKDMNRGKLIINEDGNEKAREHMVSEIPFPFRSVKDFEASIRAPIGSTFVPELPHRRMTRPPVRTKMGTIIEPMSEEILLRKALQGLPIVK